MSKNTSSNSKPCYQREQSSGCLENTGVKYYQYLAKKAGISDAAAMGIDDLPSDDIMCSIVDSLTHFAAPIAVLLTTERCHAAIGPRVHVQAPAGTLNKTTVNRYLKHWGYDRAMLGRPPPAERFQAEHSNDCWQFD
ncbi:MAG TPA: hypothetical protein VIJ25_00850, partial [Methylococcales bacterium]